MYYAQDIYKQSSLSPETVRGMGFMPCINPMYGAIGVAFTCCANDVIIQTFMGLRGKVTKYI